MSEITVEAHGRTETFADPARIAELCPFMAQLALHAPGQFDAIMEASIAPAVVQAEHAENKATAQHVEQAIEPEVTTAPVRSPEPITAQEHTMRAAEAEPEAPAASTEHAPLEQKPSSYVSSSETFEIPEAIRAEHAEPVVEAGIETQTEAIAPADIPAATRPESIEVPAVTQEVIASETSAIHAVHDIVPLQTPQPTHETAVITLTESEPQIAVESPANIALTPAEIQVPVQQSETEAETEATPLPTPTSESVPEQSHVTVTAAPELIASEEPREPLEAAFATVIEQLSLPLDQLESEPTTLQEPNTIVESVQTIKIELEKIQLPNNPEAIDAIEAPLPPALIEAVVELLVQAGYSEPEEMLQAYITENGTQSFIIMVQNLCESVDQALQPADLTYDEHEFLAVPMLLGVQDDERQNLIRSLFRLVATFGYKSRIAPDIA